MTRNDKVYIANNYGTVYTKEKYSKQRSSSTYESMGENRIVREYELVATGRYSEKIDGKWVEKHDEE